MKNKNKCADKSTSKIEKTNKRHSSNTQFPELPEQGILLISAFLQRKLTIRQSHVVDCDLSCSI